MNFKPDDISSKKHVWILDPGGMLILTDNQLIYLKKDIILSNTIAYSKKYRILTPLFTQAACGVHPLSTKHFCNLEITLDILKAAVHR